MLRRLGPSMDNATLAGELNAAGLRTGTGKAFGADAVRELRYSYRVGSPGLLGPGELTTAQVAARLGVSTNAVTYWINNALLDARRGPGNRWCIPFDPTVEAACRQRVAASPHIRPDLDAVPAGEGELSVAQVAHRLGVKPDVVYNWIDCGHLPARRGPGGRRYVSFTTEAEVACRRRIASSCHLAPEVKAQSLQPTTGG